MAKPALLFGGGTEERLVAVLCARFVMERYAFDELLFLAKDGAVSRVDRAELGAFRLEDGRDFAPAGAPLAASLEQALPLLGDVALFLCVHGTAGLDAAVRRKLEELGVPFTGPTREATLRCGDKIATKEILAARGVRTSPHLLIPRNPPAGFEVELAAFLEANQRIVLKPRDSGSSVGLHMISDRRSLERVLCETTVFSDFAMMAERHVAGRELTIGVVETESGAVALPPTEIVLDTAGVFDFQTKYVGRGATKIMRPDLPPELLERARALAVLAHRSLGCFGVSRTDTIVSDGEIVFLETNGTPGLTATSFIPKQLEAAGIELSSFIEGQLGLARLRARDARKAHA